MHVFVVEHAETLAEAAESLVCVLTSIVCEANASLVPLVEPIARTVKTMPHNVRLLECVFRKAKGSSDLLPLFEPLWPEISAIIQNPSETFGESLCLLVGHCIRHRLIPLDSGRFRDVVEFVKTGYRESMARHYLDLAESVIRQAPELLGCFNGVVVSRCTFPASTRQELQLDAYAEFCLHITKEIGLAPFLRSENASGVVSCFLSGLGAGPQSSLCGFLTMVLLSESQDDAIIRAVQAGTDTFLMNLLLINQGTSSRETEGIIALLCAVDSRFPWMIHKWLRDGTKISDGEPRLKRAREEGKLAEFFGDLLRDADVTTDLL